MSVPPNGSLGNFTIAPVPNSSPSQYQPVALENNQTIYDTVSTDHVPPGSSTNAGYHNQVTLVPQASIPSGVDGIWQIAGNGENIYLVPPKGTGAQQQLNSSAILTSGTYWSQSQTVSGCPPVTVFYYCPLGSNTINVVIQLTYPTTAFATSTVFIPYLDASGNALTITTPISSFGIGALVNATGGNVYAAAFGWGVYAAPGAIGIGYGAYQNGVVMLVGKNFTTTTTVTVAGTVQGVM